jgi:hypothetical protein
MRPASDTAVYRVCPAGPQRWDVCQDGLPGPVATFDDKATALTYALCLARGKPSWQLLFERAGRHQVGAAGTGARRGH